VSQAFETALIRKIAWRILPLILVAYCVAYLDRANIAVAALTMNKDLGFSAFTYGLGAGIFFLGYFIFEVPSNLILERVGARWWVARLNSEARSATELRTSLEVQTVPRS